MAERRLRIEPPERIDLSVYTVVLPTKNEARNICGFLAALPAAVNLIVVDSSDDATPELIASMRPSHTLVIRRQVTIPVARQIGVEAASTPWIVCTDADVSFAPDYFRELSRYQTFDAVYGPKHSESGYLGYYRWFARGQRVLDTCGVPAVSGSNFAVRRQVLLDAGGFDPTLTCNEDSEIAWRIARRGFQVALASNLVVYARDHRRLQLGAARKMLHSIARCTLLYLGLMPPRFRSADWGYWSKT